MPTQSERDRLIVALDFSSSEAALKTAIAVRQSAGIFKVGLELFSAAGPHVIERLHQDGNSVFLDLKLHDIPNTVAKAAAECARLKVRLLTVHASGGDAMLRAAVEASETTNVLAVTVLTSMDSATLRSVGVDDDVEAQVLRLAEVALKAGCHGVVASAREASALRQRLGGDFLIVTPGVRPAGSARNDQERIVTPREAIRAGADHIVVGRPITAAKDPGDAARSILEEISAAARAA